MDEKLEKEYIVRQLKCLKELTGEYPVSKIAVPHVAIMTNALQVGWYYGRLSPRSKALVFEAYKELGIPLLWESDSYCDDLPYWSDVPAEADLPAAAQSGGPQGMLMLPYT